MIKDVFLQKIKGVSASTLRNGHCFGCLQIAKEPVLSVFCRRVLRTFMTPSSFYKLTLYEDKAVLHFHGGFISEVVVPYAYYDKFNDGFSV